MLQLLVELISFTLDVHLKVKMLGGKDASIGVYLMEGRRCLCNLRNSALLLLSSDVVHVERLTASKLMISPLCECERLTLDLMDYHVRVL